MDAAPKILSNDEAAARLGVTPGTLKWWRHIGKGPPFIKFGESKQSGVGYELADIDAWKKARKFANTSAYSDAGRANLCSTRIRSADASV